VSQSQNRIGCTKSQRRLPVKKLIKSASSILGLVILFAAAVALAAGCGSGSKVVKIVTVERKPTVVKTVTAERTAAVVSAIGDQRLYGQIKSLERKGDHYELRFDPAWFLSGVTANVAKAEDEHTSCQPSACPPVPNDNYRVDEGHRLLTYLVPADARGPDQGRRDLWAVPGDDDHSRPVGGGRCGQELAEAVRAPLDRRLDPRPRRHGPDVRPAVHPVRRGIQ
jgi:hypothetical protein